MIERVFYWRSTVDLHMHNAQWREPKVYPKLCISSMGRVPYGSPFTSLIFPTIARLSLPHVKPSLGFCERICMNIVPEWVTIMVSAIFIVCVTISHPELPNMPGHTNVSLYWIEAVRINKIISTIKYSSGESLGWSRPTKKLSSSRRLESIVH